MSCNKTKLNTACQGELDKLIEITSTTESQMGIYSSYGSNDWCQYAWEQFKNEIGSELVGKILYAVMPIFSSNYGEAIKDIMGTTITFGNGEGSIDSRCVVLTKNATSNSSHTITSLSVVYAGIKKTSTGIGYMYDSNGSNSLKTSYITDENPSCCAKVHDGNVKFINADGVKETAACTVTGSRVQLFNNDSATYALICMKDISADDDCKLICSALDKLINVVLSKSE